MTNEGRKRYSGGNDRCCLSGSDGEESTAIPARGRFSATGLETRGTGKRMGAMGDKSKKDKDKGQKQNMAKQKQKAEDKSKKQPKRS